MSKSFHWKEGELKVSKTINQEGSDDSSSYRLYPNVVISITSQEGDLALEYDNQYQDLIYIRKEKIKEFLKALQEITEGS